MHVRVGAVVAGRAVSDFAGYLYEIIPNARSLAVGRRVAFDLVGGRGCAEFKRRGELLGRYEAEVRRREGGREGR